MKHISLGLFLPAVFCADQCMKYQCGKSSPSYNLTRPCLVQTSNYSAEFIPNTCDSKSKFNRNQFIATNRQYCHVVTTKVSSKSAKTELSGICKMNTTGFEFFPRAVQYPGEMCDGISAVYECKTGYKKCKAHRCQGYAEGSRCSNSFDCNFNFYCDSLNQQCKPIIENG